MNYIKKMCILRQIRQGFSGDGKSLSGLIKIEQYGKNLAVEVSIINFAPLVTGEYYCLLSDGNGKTEMLSLRGKSLFNILSDLDLSGGFCGIICYVKNDVVPIAYGINGNKSYDWKSILNAALPPVFPRKSEKSEAEFAPSGTQRLAPQNAFSDTPPQMPLAAETPPEPLPEEKAKNKPSALPQSEQYDDETVATKNYYEEKENERELLSKTGDNACPESANQEPREKTGLDVAQNDDATQLLRPIKTDPDGYYRSVKQELDGLFKKYPRDKTLDGAFSCSEWVRVRGSAKSPQYLVGVLREDGCVHYICYALAAEDKNAPPEEIKNVCAFVPISPYNDDGFFVIFQSATSGECVRPPRI